MARTRLTIYRYGYGKAILADWLSDLASIKLMTFSVAFSISSEIAQCLGSRCYHMTTKDILTNLSAGDPGSPYASTKSTICRHLQMHNQHPAAVPRVLDNLFLLTKTEREFGYAT